MTQLEQLFKETTDLLPSPYSPLNQFLADITAKPGFGFPRKAWVQLNCFHTVVGHFASKVFKMGLADSNFCKCGLTQCAKHVLQQCTILHAYPVISMMFPTQH